MSWLTDCIERRLSEGRDFPAVDSGKRGAISYAELRGLSGSVGRQLSGRGPVAILANRSAETYVAVLACFRAGVAYVPLNPSFPAARLSKIIALSGARQCLFEPAYQELAEQLDIARTALTLEQSDGDWEPQARDDQATVYRLFTSGSTGEPKGVPIHHGALSHYVENIIERVRIPECRRSTQFFDLSFDLSMHDIFVTFATGGTLVPASDLDLMTPHRFVARNRIDLWFSVPILAVSATRGQAARPEKPTLEKALFCGEALPTRYAEAMRQLLRPGGEIWNLYGPTEATIAFTAELFLPDCERTDTVPLGGPFGQNEIAILMDGEIVPAGEGAEGELLLSGPQVFSGYEPRVEQSPFAEDEAGRRFYRTGDSVRIVEGKLLYIGRLDDQVKIRGHRVELGEIEAVFRKLPSVEASAAIVVGEAGTNVVCLAYQADRDVDWQPVRDLLPDYMIPTRVARFVRLPTNASGKIDRKQLKSLLC